MSVRHLLGGLAAGLLLLSPSDVQAQGRSTDRTSREQQMLRRHFDRNLERLGQEARRSLPGLMLYPQEIREAVLIAAQDPVLIVRTVSVDEAVLDDVLAEVPQDVADALVVLADEPQVLDVLVENLVATSVVGRVYADDPRFIMNTVNRLAEQARAEHDASVALWADELKNDPDVMEQFEEAATAYAEDMGYEEPEAPVIVNDSYDSYDDDWWFVWYGWYRYPGRIHIGDLPSDEFCEWLLDRCDRYPELADRVVEHVRERRANGKGEQFPGEMGNALTRWQERNPFTTMNGFMHSDGHRTDRLREYGTAMRNVEGSDASTRSANLRRYLSEHGASYPALSRPGGPDRLRSAGTTPAPRGASPRTPHRPATGGREIRRVTPSQHQQMQRAVSRHRSAWRGYNRGRPSYHSVRVRGAGGRGMRRR